MGLLNNSRLLHFLTLTVIVITVIAFAASAITLVPPRRQETISLGPHADAIIYNEQITLLYSDEAIGLGNYTDDIKEPSGWELFPSIFWDSNRDHVLEANESIGHAVSPSIHFTYASESHHFL